MPLTTTAERARPPSPWGEKQRGAEPSQAERHDHENSRKAEHYGLVAASTVPEDKTFEPGSGKMSGNGMVARRRSLRRVAGLCAGRRNPGGLKARLSEGE